MGYKFVFNVHIIQNRNFFDTFSDAFLYYVVKHIENILYKLFQMTDLGTVAIH